jgi:hypothetical protein
LSSSGRRKARSTPSPPNTCSSLVHHLTPYDISGLLLSVSTLRAARQERSALNRLDELDPLFPLPRKPLSIDLLSVQLPVPCTGLRSDLSRLCLQPRHLSGSTINDRRSSVRHLTTRLGSRTRPIMTSSRLLSVVLFALLLAVSASASPVPAPTPTPAPVSPLRLLTRTSLNAQVLARTENDAGYPYFPDNITSCGVCSKNYASLDSSIQAAPVFADVSAVSRSSVVYPDHLAAGQHPHATATVVY